MKKFKWKYFFKEIYNKFFDDDILGLGAQSSYYLILSFFPFLIFLITMISYTPITSDAALKNLEEYLPQNIYVMVLDIIKQIMNQRSTALMSIGMIVTIWTASYGIETLIKGINRAYNFKETRSFIKLKLISIFFTFCLSLVFMMSMTMLVLGEVVVKNLFIHFNLSNFYINTWDFARFIIPLLTLFTVFSLIYRFIPNGHIPYKHVLSGSIFATFGWVIISILFSYYVSNFANYSKTYGSIGSIIGLLIWLYWSSIIVILGGVVNATLFKLKKLNGV